MNRLKRLALTLCAWFQIPRNYLFCIISGLHFDKTWRFYGMPVIHVGRHGGRITIGKRFSAVSDNRHNSFGIIQPVVIKTVGVNAVIEIGDDVGISGCTISAEKFIKIGSRVLIGSGAIIVDNDAHPINPVERRKGMATPVSAQVIIEDDVFIGARAIILKGVTIGQGSMVGAGAVVSRNVPPCSKVVGNPAVIVGKTVKGA